MLALLVLGESLSAGQAVGCVLVLGCIILAALEPRAVIEEAGAGTGVRLAIVAAAAFGGYLFGLAILSEELGWLVPILLTRTVAVAILATVKVAGRVPQAEHMAGRLVLACLAAASSTRPGTWPSTAAPRSARSRSPARRRPPTP